MTEGEAKVVAALLMSADGYCGNCGVQLFRRAKKIWPEFSWDAWEEPAMFAFDKETEFSLWDDYSLNKLNLDKLQALLGQ